MKIKRKRDRRQDNTDATKRYSDTRPAERDSYFQVCSTSLNTWRCASMRKRRDYIDPSATLHCIALPSQRDSPRQYFLDELLKKVSRTVQRKKWMLPHLRPGLHGPTQISNFCLQSRQVPYHQTITCHPQRRRHYSGDGCVRIIANSFCTAPFLTLSSPRHKAPRQVLQTDAVRYIREKCDSH